MLAADRILDHLLQFAVKVRKEETLEFLLPVVVDTTLAVLAADHASIRILGRDDELLSAARSGEGILARPAGFHRGEGVLGWVCEMGLPARVDDTSSDRRFVEKDDQGFGIGSLLAVPIKSAGRVIGVLSAAAKSVRAFGEADVHLAELVANASSSAIAAARVKRLTAPATLPE